MSLLIVNDLSLVTDPIFTEAPIPWLIVLVQINRMGSVNEPATSPTFEPFSLVSTVSVVLVPV